jgi:hypothetical protein
LLRSFAMDLTAKLMLYFPRTGLRGAGEGAERSDTGECFPVLSPLRVKIRT